MKLGLTVYGISECRRPASTVALSPAAGTKSVVSWRWSDHPVTAAAAEVSLSVMAAATWCLFGLVSLACVTATTHGTDRHGKDQWSPVIVGSERVGEGEGGGRRRRENAVRPILLIVVLQPVGLPYYRLLYLNSTSHSYHWYIGLYNNNNNNLYYNSPYGFCLLTAPHRTSVSLICGRYRPSSGPIALRHVLNCPPWHTFFTVRCWHFSSAAFVEKSSK